MGDIGEDVTAILARWNAGDRAALEQLVPVVYGELRKIAVSHMRREDAGNTIAITGLVHEVYLHLVDQRSVQFQNRSHFFGAAAQIMRRILVDHAREKNALKRGGDRDRLTLTSGLDVEAPQNPDVLDLNEALTELEQFDARKARVVELRYFAGLSVPETAEVLSLSTATVKREWAIARAWLYDRLNGEGSPES